MTKQFTRLNSPLEAKSFVKWAGSKRALVDCIMQFMPSRFDAYFEPFFRRWGNVFFSLSKRTFKR